jgi:hypothetical protein
MRDQVAVSNSLPFLLARTRDTVDIGYPFYEADLVSFTRGLKRQVRWIPTARGRRVHLFYHCNLQVDWNLRFFRLAKRVPESFTSYHQYTGFLRDQIRAVVDNAAHPARRFPYRRIVATVSSGYDSPAVAVLLEESGVDARVVTFPKERPAPGEEAHEDSGGEIAAHLGFPYQEFERSRYREREDLVEAEFLAQGTRGEDVVMAGLESELRGVVLFTGTWGGELWRRMVHTLSPNIFVRDPQGASLEEFRLRVGFIHVVPASFGCTRYPALARISRSPEMAPWSVGGRYDRPIPRRIVEERGIRREAFGQKKKAVSQPFNTPSDGVPRPPMDLPSIMTPRGYEDFEAFLETADRSIPARRRAWFRIMRWMFKLNIRVCWRVNRLAERREWDYRLHPVMANRYEREVHPQAYIFHWAVEKVLPRYRSDAPVDERAV